jgi:hypothetical protein
MMKKEIPKQQLERLLEMTLPEGIVQHCEGEKFNFKFPSSIDDNTRALIILSRLYPEFNDGGTHEIYLNFIKDARRKDGFFNNYKSLNGEWKADKVVSQDCFGRAMWALSEFIDSEYPQKERDEAEDLFFQSLDLIRELSFPLSMVFTSIGLSKYLENSSEEEIFYFNFNLTERLKKKFLERRDETWRWFSDKMTYCNARFPQAMFLGGGVLKNEMLKIVGVDSMDFLIQESFDDEDRFNAIGNSNWYMGGERKSIYDQQTIEAGAMVEACVCGYKITGYEEYLRGANNVFDWFKGKNIGRHYMLAENGGVYDGITKNGYNTNQGAESLISYLMASTSLNKT